MNIILARYSYWMHRGQVLVAEDDELQTDFERATERLTICRAAQSIRGTGMGLALCASDILAFTSFAIARVWMPFILRECLARAYIGSYPGMEVSILKFDGPAI